MTENKNQVWITLNRSLLGIYQISGFIFETKDIGNISNADILRDTLSLSCRNSLNNFLLFSGNIFKEYAITELNKIVNYDRFPQSVTLHSFMKEFYSQKDSDQWNAFGKWKKKTGKVREKLCSARNKFSAHLDKESVQGNIYFDLDADEIDNFIRETLFLFDFLYNKDTSLKKQFDEKISPGIFHQSPSKVAESWRNILVNRINFLKKCCKNSH